MDGNIISQLRTVATKSDAYSHGHEMHCTFPCMIPEPCILSVKHTLVVLLTSTIFPDPYSLTIGHHLLESGPKTSGHISRIFPAVS